MSADAGYCSEENLAGLEARTIDAYVATGRARDAVAGTEKGEPSSAQPDETTTRIETMRAKIPQQREIRSAACSTLSTKTPFTPSSI